MKSLEVASRIALAPPYNAKKAAKLSVSAAFHS
jgi:hypothetical protein